MRTPSALFARRYRAALLDFLLGGDEQGLARAYELGRTAIDTRLGLLDVLRGHQRTVDALLVVTRDAKQGLARLRAAEAFLMETLSPFEMTHRGYTALVLGSTDTARRPRRVRRRRDR